MAKKPVSRRKVRKQLMDFFNSRCQAGVFDIDRDMRLINGRTRLKGVFTATGIYGAAFVLAWYAWSNGHISQEILQKVSWIIILPATIAGLLVWLISFNREENLIIGRLSRAMRDAEAEDGFLWRYGPLLAWADHADYDTKQLVNFSRDRDLERIEPESYAKAICSLQKMLENMGDQPINDELVLELENNLQR